MDINLVALNDYCLIEILSRMKLKEKIYFANTSICPVRVFEMQCKRFLKEVSIVQNKCRIIHHGRNDSEEATFTDVSHEHLFKVASNCIEVLTISRNPSIVLLIPKLPNLRELRLGECHQYSRILLIRTFRLLNTIQSLELSFNEDLGTEVMNELVANGMNLQHLAIYTKDKRASLNMITQLPNLNSLDVNIDRRPLRSLLSAQSGVRGNQLNALIIRSNACNYKDFALIANFKKLKTIVFCKPGPCFTSEYPFKKLSELNYLEDLHIYNDNGCINERGALLLMMYCINIKNLSIRPTTILIPNFLEELIKILRNREIKLTQPMGIDLFNCNISYEEKMIMEEASDVLTIRSFRRKYNIRD